VRNLPELATIRQVARVLDGGVMAVLKVANCSRTPAACVASAIEAASGSRTPIGFSQDTLLPAAGGGQQRLRSG